MANTWLLVDKRLVKQHTVLPFVLLKALLLLRVCCQGLAYVCCSTRPLLCVLCSHVSGLLRSLPAALSAYTSACGMPAFG